MFTMEQFSDLGLGDVVEVAPLFKALSDQPVTLEVVKISPDAARVEFTARYFTAVIGEWVCELRDGALEWVLS